MLQFVLAPINKLPNLSGMHTCSATWKNHPMRTKYILSKMSLSLGALGLALSLTTASATAASLNKCVDEYGKVTYSNLPCKGANQVRKIEIDPAPPVRVAPPAPIAAPALPPAALPDAPKVDVPVYVMPEKPPIVITPKSSTAAAEKKTEIKFETLGGPKKQSQNNCDTLSDKLGLVLDKMDAARRKGYTQKQMDDWNSEIKTLERKKQQSGCF